MQEQREDESKADGLRDIVRSVKLHLEMERSFGVTHLPLARRGEGSMNDKAAQLAALEAELSECSNCALGQSRTNLVFGAGDPNADLMFVGEAPGHDEDLQGEPFVGRAGKLLTRVIEAIGMSRDQVYIANILKCRPPGNRNPRLDEILRCYPHLRQQIEIIRPKVIVALGGVAAQTLLETDQTIGKLRGSFRDYDGIKLMATYHTAYLLRNPGDKRKVWEDMKKVRDELKRPTA